MTTYEQLSRRRAELLRAAASHKARSLKVFGSVARGEDRPDSDIDFLVEFEPDASLLDLIGLQQDIEALLGRRADVVTPNGVSPLLRERILSEARPL
jgi:predicted nucleotidyltransferase